MLLGICSGLSAQTPKLSFSQADYDSAYYYQFSQNKVIPEELRPQALIALSFYPELKEAHVVFKLKKKVTPLTSRPKVGSIFRRASKRTYVITISTESIGMLDPILFKNLPYNAQIGVLGHEIAHALDYHSKSSWQILGIAMGMISSKYTDRFEYNTDLRCIEHGLGHQLYAWSKYVREALDISMWKGAENDDTSAKERYMDPETIKRYMHGLRIYDAF